MIKPLSVYPFVKKLVHGLLPVLPAFRVRVFNDEAHDRTP